MNRLIIILPMIAMLLAGCKSIPDENIQSIVLPNFIEKTPVAQTMYDFTQKCTLSDGIVVNNKFELSCDCSHIDEKSTKYNANDIFEGCNHRGWKFQ